MTCTTWMKETNTNPAEEMPDVTEIYSEQERPKETDLVEGFRIQCKLIMLFSVIHTLAVRLV